MLAGGPMALTALLLVRASAQMETGARIETRVGDAPTGALSVPSDPTSVPVAAQQAQVMVVATPILKLRWTTGVDDVRLDSATRIFWRPVPLLGTRPLFLETLGATDTRRPTKRSRWRLDLRGTYGEEDYTSLSQQFANQPTLPVSTTMFMANGSVDALWRNSRRTTLTFRLGVIHRRTLDAQPVASKVPGTSLAPLSLPTQTSVTASPALHWTVTRRFGIEASAPVFDYDFQDITQASAPAGHTNIASIQPQMGFLEELSRRHQLHFVAGLTFAYALQGSNTKLGHHVTPLVRVDLNSTLYRTRATAVQSSVGAGTNWLVDPVLGTGVWRGVAQANFDATIGPHWTTGARFMFTTNLSARLPTADGPSANGAPIYIDETIVSAEIPVRHRWSNLLLVEFGGRFAERAPRLSAPRFAWRERELWAFLTLFAATRVQLSTARSPGNTIEM